MAANAVVAFSAHGGQQSYVDPAWYADSGATHHITHEPDKLTTKSPTPAMSTSTLQMEQVCGNPFRSSGPDEPDLWTNW
jgi:hypothetical protein